MDGCESRTIKKAECQKICVFESLLNFKEIKSVNPNGKNSLEELMLKLKLQYFGHLMQRTDSLEKTLMMGKMEGKRRKGWQRIWLNSITDSMDMNLRKLWKIVKDRGAWGAAVHGVTELDMT